MTPGQLSLEDARPVTLTDSQRDVLRAFMHAGPTTDVHLAQYYSDYRYRYRRQSPSGLRSRRAELVKLGLVAPTGERVPVPTSSRLAAVWQITLAGRDAL